MADAPPTRCANCEEVVAARYCPACGQDIVPRKQSVWELTSGLSSNLVGADSRTWRSIFPLLFRPGWLTEQNLAGRWRSYLPPVRLYLFFSLLCFLVLSLTQDPLEGQDISFSAPGNLENNQDEDFRPFPEGSLFGAWFNDPIEQRARHLAEADPEEVGRALLAEFFNALPTFLLLLPPLFALCCKLLYLFSGRWFFEHFIFGLHFYSFVFAQVSLAALIPWTWWSLIVALWIPLYAYKAMRRIYRQSRPWTVIKTLGLLLAHLPLTALVLAITFVYAFFQV